MRIFDRIPAVALAVYAHPDDADVAAGGSMAIWSASGTRVHLVIVCDGAKGSLDDTTDVEILRGRRARELAEAAQLLGVTSVQCLDYADGDFSNDAAFRERLVRVIRDVKPDVVLGPDPTATFFGGVYVNHRDHRETGWALLDAVAPASAMPLYFPDSGMAHAVTDLLLSGTHEPDVIVDVTSAIDLKIRAVQAHSSQLADDPVGVGAIMRGRAQHAGREIGVAYGEAFRYVAFAR